MSVNCSSRFFERLQRTQKKHFSPVLKKDIGWKRQQISGYNSLRQRVLEATLFWSSFCYGNQLKNQTVSSFCVWQFFIMPSLAVTANSIQSKWNKPIYFVILGVHLKITCCLKCKSCFLRWEETTIKFLCFQMENNKTFMSKKLSR